jgi:bifunctional DNase/RNase
MTARKRTDRKAPQSGGHEMTISCFALDSIARMPMVILKDDGEHHTLPIWLSSMEAVAIAAELINRDALAESGGEDLMTGLLGRLQLEVRRIAIEGINGSLFDSCIYFSGNDGEIRVKVRPCDAVVMALKHSLPIHVADEVLDRASMLDMDDNEEFGDDAGARFIDLLESLDPKDMGKYPM